MGKVKIHKGFIGAITAVAVIAVLAGTAIRLQSISADTTTPDATGNGLKGEYFKTVSPTGTPEFTCLVKKLEFNWIATQPTSAHDGCTPQTGAVGIDNFSVKYTGQVQPQYSDTYTFYALTDDGVKVWVNSQLIINTWTNQTSSVESKGTIALQAGKKYPIKIEYYNGVGNAQMQLLWSNSHSLTAFTSHQVKQTIPQSRLYTDWTPPSASATASPSTTVMTETFKGGTQGVSKYTALYLPADTTAIATKQLQDAGLTVWAFNRRYVEDWNTDIVGLNHGVGYYVGNPSGVDKTVTVNQQVAESASNIYMRKGWNLLANSSTKAVSLADLKYYLNPTCTQTTNASGKIVNSNCTVGASTTPISDLFQGTDVNAYLAYTTIYEIKNPEAQTASEAFDQVTVTASNASTLTIPAQTMFWLYIW
ncbi:MAG: PA14 domain-containing protein [Candidatus Berkelbacteria bacterium]|nr:PA14 domain-containing protein [Candidatus Berkelbacteria bacterium]